MTKTPPKSRPERQPGRQTRILEAARPSGQRHFVNPALVRGSTVLFADCAELKQATKHPFDGLYYGRIGTPTSQAIEKAMAELYDIPHAIALSSGLAAITCALIAFAEKDTHMLISDGVYQPTRKFCDQFLQRFGVTIEYYDPLDIDALQSKIRANTRIIFLESPSSLTFEVADIAQTATLAHKHNIRTILDNTWAGGWYGPAFTHGIDIVIEAGTKYVTGHADASIGFILCSPNDYTLLKSSCVALGNAPGAEDCSLALRGLKTLALRIEKHRDHALALAQWCAQRKEIRHVLHPALPTCPGHAHWKQYHSGSTGLFSIVLEPCDPQRIERMVDSLQHFSIGYSWGSHESLILPVFPELCRSLPHSDALWRQGPVLRLHAGLEDIDDLIEDLRQGLRHLNL